MARRFIKLYEQIMNWEWYRHPNTLCLFIHLLLKAHYKDTEIGGRMIHRGQLVTSLPSLSTGTGLSIQQIRTALLHLKSTGEITDESTNQYRIITVVKYDDYQTSTGESTGNQQAINRQPNRQSTDELTPYIEYIEQIESNRKIEPPKGGRGASRFQPPTKEDILDFCLAEGLNLDVDRFFNYYAAQGWKLSNGNAMKDWQAAVRQWIARDRKRDQAPVKKVSAQQYSQRDYKNEQMEAMLRMIEGGA